MYVIKNENTFPNEFENLISNSMDNSKLDFCFFYEVFNRISHSTKKILKDELVKRYKNNTPKMNHEGLLNDEVDGMFEQLIPQIKEIYYHVCSKALEKNLCSSEEYADIMKENDRLRMAVMNCPTFGIESKLYSKLRLSQDQYKTIKENDIYDVAHLAIAVLYCDFVLIDKKMFQLCEKELKLGEKYNTKIYSCQDIEQMIKDISSL